MSLTVDTSPPVAGPVKGTALLRALLGSASLAVLFASVLSLQGFAEPSPRLARLPLAFEASADGASFLCRGQGMAMQLVPGGLQFALQAPGTTRALTLASVPQQPDDAHGRGWTRGPGDRSQETATAVRLGLRLVNANPAAALESEAPLPTRINYLIGNDPKAWRVGVPTSARVRSRGVYPGVDVVFYGRDGQLEHDFIVAPGARADAIRFAVEGADAMELEPGGDLVIQVAGHTVRLQKPEIYQEGDARRESVSGGFKILDAAAREVGFQLGGYDASRPLIIDPVLLYWTFFGGNGPDQGWDLKVTPGREVVFTGGTFSRDMFVTNALYPVYEGTRYDAFVAKVAATGTNLVFSTYLGGTEDDIAFGAALDPAGNIYLTGATYSENFPVTTNALAKQIHGIRFFGYYQYDAFVAKLDPNGAALLYSSYYGGAFTDNGTGIAADSAGNAYITGFTSSPDLPVVPTNGVGSKPGGGADDAFVAKLSTTSSNLYYSLYLGGAGTDRGQGIAINTDREAFVTGWTGSSVTFPVTTNVPSGTNFGGSLDIFVTKLATNGASLLFSRYLGGIFEDRGFRLALDTNGSVYVTGSSRSTNYPVLNPYAATNSGLLDIVVTKLDGNDGQILYSTYFGGEFDDEGWGIDVDPEGQAHVTGITGSGFFFPVVNAFQPVSGGLRDAFVLKLSASGSHVIYSSFLGGYNEDGGYGIAVGPNNSAYVTGYTYSATQYPLPGTDWSQSGTNLFDNAFLAQILPINPSLRGRLDEQDALVLAWPAELSSFKVVSTGTLGRTNTTWTNVTATPVIVGPPADPDSLSVVVITNPPPNQFYKLAPPW